MVPLFCYTEEEVCNGLANKAAMKSSKLDALLNERWEHAMSEGLFRYDLTGVVTRTVPGDFGFIVQQNPKRRTHRRAPSHMTTLRQDFDPSLFNFNEIKSGEVLFELSRVSDTGTKMVKRHLMLVNVSPITHNHALLVPEPNRCLPQVLTEDTIQLCLEILALSNCSGLCIVANSLLAYASVNHLHYHILHVNLPVLASRVRGEHIGNCVYRLSDHPSPGFGFQLNSSTQSCARDIYKVVNILLECNVPHNMVILRGEPFNQTESHHQVIRAILIPRKPLYGQKVLASGKEAPPFSAAACELAQGFIPVYDEHRYHSLTESEILQVLAEQMVTKSEFQILRDKVVSSF